MSTDIDFDRWEETDNGKYGAHWVSKEDKRITVNVNKEELEDWIDEGVTENAYLVFPALNDRGIPNSPDIYTETDYSGNLEDAKKAAVEIAQKIMRLPINKIINFDWRMLE